MKKLLALLTTFSISMALYGQNERLIDSLIQATKSGISAQDKVDAYNKIAFEYSGQDSVQSNLFVSKAFEIANQIEYAVL